MNALVTTNLSAAACPATGFGTTRALAVLLLAGALVTTLAASLTLGGAGLLAIGLGAGGLVTGLTAFAHRLQVAGARTPAVASDASATERDAEGVNLCVLLPSVTLALATLVLTLGR